MSSAPFTTRGGFTPEQQAAFSDRGRELAVAAAAGSGKTSVLVERILHRLLGVDSAGRFVPEGAVAVDRLLVVTFTVAAAEELRARLARELLRVLERAELPPAVRQLARRQLMLLPQARISTIHSFCAAVLRQHGAAAGLTSRRQLADHESKLLLHRLASEFLDARLDGSDRAATALALAWGGADGVGPEDLGRGAHRSGGLRELLLGLCDFRRSLVSAEAWFAALPLHWPLDPQHCDPEHPLVGALFADLRRWAGAAAEATRTELAELVIDHPGTVHLELLAVRAAALDDIAQVQAWGRAQLLLAALYAVQNGAGGTADIKWKPTLLGMVRRDIPKDSQWYAGVERRKDAVKTEADRWAELFDQPWEAVARIENETAAHLLTLWRLATQFEAEYADYKAARGVQDYADLERGALRLLAQQAQGTVALDGAGRPLPSAAALALRAQLDEVLIDEYQDTNQLQDAILDLVTPRRAHAGGAGRARFVVGDVKQSIYGFRLAEPELFQALCNSLAAGDGAAGALQRLNRNFRSRRRVVAAINAVFQGVLTPEFGGEDYAAAALEYGADYAGAFAAEGAPDTPDQPAGLHCVVVERGGSHDDESAEDGDDDGAGGPGGFDSADAAAYAYTAQLLTQIHAGGQPVLDPDAPAGSRVRPVAWRDMVILLRATTGLEELRRALAAAGVPHLAASRSGFYERPEVADALALLAVIDNPLQDIPLAAVLRGPAVGLGVEELLDAAQAGDDAASSLWARLCARRDDPVRQDALAESLRAVTAQLAQWRGLAQYVPLPELLWRVYHDSGLLLAAGALRGGAQRHANLLELHEQTRRFSAYDRQGLTRFIEEQRRLALAAGDAGEPPLPGDGQDMVRIMTVHQAKGLEFPVVVLPDAHRSFNELNLRADALWDKRAGLGGVHLDLRAPEPRKTRTLAHRQVHSAKRRALLEEELRLLYVALTRARERLEVVAAVKPASLEDEAPPPERARSRWDWLRRQLGAELASALAAEDGVSRTGGGAWAVRVLPATEVATPAIPAGAGARPVLSAAEVADAAKRAAAPYAGGPAAPAPYKLVVTDIARRERQGSAALADAAEGGADLRLAGDALAAPRGLGIRPRLLPADRAPGAAAVGSAVHAVLHSLLRSGAFRAQCSAAEVAQALAGLRERQTAEAAAIQRVSAEHLAEAVDAVSVALALDTARLYSELPLSLSADLPDLASAPVIVQGTLDLLAVWPERALVLDFKTDHGASAELLRGRYAAQLGWYCRMARALTGLPVAWALYGLGGAGLVGPFEWTAGELSRLK